MVLKQTTHRVLSDQDCWFLGALEKIRKAAISFVVSVRPSCVRIEYSASTGRILMKFDFWRFFWKSVETIQVILKCKNNVYFTWIPMYVYYSVLLIFS